MPVNLFLLPMTGTGTRADPWRGKYSKHPQVTRRSNIRYSNQDDAIVLIQAPQAYLDSVAAEPDATLLATQDNIDEQLTVGQANAAKIIFEDAFIPDLFINAGDTRREVIRGVVGMFLFSQRMEGIFGEGWKAKAKNAGMTMDSTWQDFPQVLQSGLITVRDDWGWTNAEVGVTNTSTAREILKAISDQFESTRITMSRFEI